jgi:hypothetical protein
MWAAGYRVRQREQVECTVWRNWEQQVLVRQLAEGRQNYMTQGGCCEWQAVAGHLGSSASVERNKIAIAGMRSAQLAG